MATESIARLSTIIAKTEVTPGTDVSPAGGTDDVTIVDSENTWQMQAGFVAIDAHRTSFTPATKDAVNQITAAVNCQGLLQGPTTRGVPDNGSAGMLALFTSAGVHSVNTTGASGTCQLKPATKAQWLPATVKGEMDGFTVAVPYCMGTSLDMFADLQANVKPRWSYAGIGNYTEPVIGSIASVAAPDRAVSAIPTAASITPSGDSAYNCAAGLVLMSWRLRVNPQIGIVSSMCAENGVVSFKPIARRSTLELTLAVDTNDSVTVDIEDVHSDLKNSINHAVAFGWGADPYKWAFAAATAQIISPPAFTTVNGVRAITVAYKLFSATAEGEWTLAVGNPT